MSFDRLALAGSRVPRYTSYPTAAQFTAEIGPAEARRWLAGIDPAQRISLYLHIPFCRQLCWYCGCNTSVTSRDLPIDRYLETLHRELALVTAELPAGPSVSHLHFGGGTPTIVSAASFTHLMAALRARFDLLADAEIAVEIDPRGFDDARADALVASGVNRVSLGIQDLDAQVQAAINRVQPLELVAETVARLRARGVNRISMDLIYGLPHQTAATITRTVADVARLGPDRISLFGYAHVPWMKSHQRLLEPAGLPDAAARLALSDAATAALNEAGYVSIGIDHFARAEDSLAQAAKSGRMHRNFQGYTTDDATVLIALGASAISSFADGFTQNATRIDDWHEAIARGELATARGVRIHADDRRRGRIIERLMCSFAADLSDDVAADPALAADLERLGPLVAAGLVEREGARLSIPEAARPFARIVAANFDAYLKEASSRHAAAV